MSTEVTIFDVAKVAGVSISSVSRVINGKAERYRIGSSAQARVLAAVRQLGYQPDMIARNVALGKGAPPRPAASPRGISGGNAKVENEAPDRRQIGLFISAASPASTLAFIPGVEPVMAEAGYELVVVTVSGDPVAAQKRVTQFLGKKTAGMLCCPSLYSAVSATVNGKCPVMVLWQGAGSAMLKAVDPLHADAPAAPSGQAESVGSGQAAESRTPVAEIRSPPVTLAVASVPPPVVSAVPPVTPALETNPMEGGASACGEPVEPSPPPAPESTTPVLDPVVTSPPVLEPIITPPLVLEPVVEPPPSVDPVSPPEVIPEPVTPAVEPVSSPVVSASLETPAPELTTPVLEPVVEPPPSVDPLPPPVVIPETVTPAVEPMSPPVVSASPETPAPESTTPVLEPIAPPPLVSEPVIAPFPPVDPVPPPAVIPEPVTPAVVPVPPPVVSASPETSALATNPLEGGAPASSEPVEPSPPPAPESTTTVLDPVVPSSPMSP